MLSNIYQDKFTRWHDKEIKNEDFSSNNAFIYTAYSKYLAPNTVDDSRLVDCYSQCIRKLVPLKMDRHPGDSTPALSKDEVIGAVSLGLLHEPMLALSHWNFCNLEYEPKKLGIVSIIKALVSFYRINKEVTEQKLEGSRKRNYMWQNNITDAYSLGFWLAWHDQYYVVKMAAKKPTMFQTLLFYINFISVLTTGNRSVRMLLWLQLEDMKHFLLKYAPKEKWVRDYFEPQHPFVKGLE